MTRDFTDFLCFFLFILLNICYFCSKILRTHKIPYLQIHCNRFRYATKIKKNRPESSEIRIYFRNFSKKSRGVCTHRDFWKCKATVISH